MDTDTDTDIPDRLGDFDALTGHHYDCHEQGACDCAWRIRNVAERDLAERHAASTSDTERLRLRLEAAEMALGAVGSLTAEADARLTAIDRALASYERYRDGR